MALKSGTRKEKLHRDGDLPAAIAANGDQYWYKDGKLRRDSDKAAIISADGTQLWYKDGLKRCVLDTRIPSRLLIKYWLIE